MLAKGVLGSHWLLLFWDIEGDSHLKIWNLDTTLGMFCQQCHPSVAPVDADIQCLKCSQKRCRFSCDESQIVNMKNQYKSFWSSSSPCGSKLSAVGLWESPTLPIIFNGEMPPGFTPAFCLCCNFVYLQLGESWRQIRWPKLFIYCFQ